MATETRVRCGGQNEWGGRCTRDAVEGLTQCGPHRAGQKRREENQAKRDQKSDRQRAFYRVRAAQAAYVAAWRERKPLQAYGPNWTCPLCSCVVQPPPYPPNGPSLDSLAENHRRFHGQDWLDYQRAGQAE